MLASGEQLTYPVGIVNLGLHGQEWPTFFLEGPPGSLALLGAFTLEGFALAPDPVNKRLVPVVSLLACSSGRSVNEGDPMNTREIFVAGKWVHTVIRGGQRGCVAISPRATSSRGAEV
jgi:hypothetical protein